MKKYQTLSSHSIKCMEIDIKMWAELGYSLVTMTTEPYVDHPGLIKYIYIMEKEAQYANNAML